MQAVLEKLRERKAESIELLQNFVVVESFSHDKEGIDQLSNVLTEVFSKYNLTIERYPQEQYGDHIRFQLGQGHKQILLISHLDTVYPKGTIKTMPFIVEEGKVMGPGVIDIKASYVMVYHLFDLLQDVELNDYQIVWLLTSDEEIGSPSGKVIVEQEAGKSDAVLVLEPATDDGEIKTARKGGGKFTVAVTGISAHAGLNPQDGANAIEELAYQITNIVSFANESKGTTINTGEIKGGNLFNVVPDFASAEIDVRVTEMSEVARIEEAFQTLRVRNKRTKLKVTGSVYRPPLIRTDQTSHLFHLAQNIGNQINVELTDKMVGGGSDGNYAAKTGKPVLDGLGPYGGFAHSPNEYLWIDTIAERTAIVYGLIRELISNGK
ncbi:M20 family metallopeptidase [Alkalihalobacillus sp. BA299]|uniref:M20 family metallopeptidase n=1 Tax=Alkalihalobacillus sp. BA299 TaxID=2815938 RepID=UPI001AD972B0|nr:M20 family metallopeptidase [Alkalihalobacillus sp. BA299]